MINLNELLSRVVYVVKYKTDRSAKGREEHQRRIGFSLRSSWAPVRSVLPPQSAVLTEDYGPYLLGTSS